MNAAQQRVLDALARRAEQADPADPALRERLLARHAARAQAWASPAPAGAPAAAAAWPAQLLAGLDLARTALHAADADPRAWAALRMERRLAEPVAAEAASLGPLHTQVLLPRALQRLRELSPEYLQRLLALVDELSALPVPAGPTSPGATPRAAATGAGAPRRRSTPGRAR